MKQAIIGHQAAASAARAARLLERIKIETRWLLISVRDRSFEIKKDSYATDRAKLVALWPAIRHRRIAPGAAFYDVVNDQAALLTHLIEIRRQRIFLSATATTVINNKELQPCSNFVSPFQP